MKLNTGNLKGNIKFQSFIILSVILFIYKVFVYSSGSWIHFLINGVLSALTIISLIIYLIEFSHSRKINPLALVINVGVLNAVLFFMFTYSDSILSSLLNINTGKINQGIFDNIISFFYFFAFTIRFGDSIRFIFFSFIR